MRFRRRITLVVMSAALALILTGCSTSGGDDKNDSQAQPATPATGGITEPIDDAQDAADDANDVIQQQQDAVQDLEDGD
ncbi:MAG: hypothetical protein U1E26_07230 [Coriobacteriia bacterium]|nr:hypothetical protein [Coriobacteriia bacterium]